MNKWIALILITLTIIMFTHNIYAYAEGGYLDYEAYEEGLRNRFQESAPFLYKVMLFFNPPALNNDFGAVMTVVCAVCSLMLLVVREGIVWLIRVAVLLLGLYSWIRMACFFIIMFIFRK